MYIGREFSTVFSPMIYFDGFDFINDLDIGDSVVSATSNLTVQTGYDPSPSSRLFGAPLVLSSTSAAQSVGNLLPGVTYILQIIATTSQGIR